MRILFPSDLFDKRKPDEAFEEEFIAAKSIGLPCSVYSAEDFERGEFAVAPPFAKHEGVIYRGWMMTPEKYSMLHAAIENAGATPVTSPMQYQYAHYLPEWYSVCEDVTPLTRFFPADADFSAVPASLGWSAYFVKDYVKSQTTSRGSIAKDADEIKEIVGLIKKYRGQIEGGVSLREFERLLPESEERYFVFNGKVFSRSDSIPEVAHVIAARIKCSFYSMDIVLNDAGTPRLMELGDGQVSGRKSWPANKFMEIFRS